MRSRDNITIVWFSIAALFQHFYRFTIIPTLVEDFTPFQYTRSNLTAQREIISSFNTYCKFNSLLFYHKLQFMYFPVARLIIVEGECLTLHRPVQKFKGILSVKLCNSQYTFSIGEDYFNHYISLFNHNTAQACKMILRNSKGFFQL